MIVKSSFIKISKIKYRYLHTIVVYGDSNSHGFNPLTPTRFAYADRWTSILNSYLGKDYEVINESLSGRTTVHDDNLSPNNGEENINGRVFLKTVLNTHKPINTVILALGTNDFKSLYNLTTYDVVAGIKVLINDIRSSKEVSDNSQIPPQILVLGPPPLHSTPINKIWGFPIDIDAKAKKVSALLSSCNDIPGVFYLSMYKIVKVSEIDGIHYDITSQHLIAKAIEEKLRKDILKHI